MAGSWNGQYLSAARQKCCFYEVFLTVLPYLKVMPTYCKPLSLLAFFLLFASPTMLLGQFTLEATVIDADHEDPLPYATVMINNSDKGTLTNLEGRFSLLVDKEDSIRISFIGYETLVLPASAIITDPLISLSAQSVTLSSATVYANDDFLYELVAKAGKRLEQVHEQKSKAYFQIVSTTNEQPVEMVQGYYNSQHNNQGLKKLSLKSGRVALAAQDSSYFASLGTTQALGALNLRIPNESFPGIPLQYNRNGIRRRYRLERRADYSNDQLLHIAFEPIRNNRKHFGGEIWIDRQDYTVHKLILRQKDLRYHPLRPVWRASEIERLDLELSYNFEVTGTTVRLSHISWLYAVFLTHDLQGVEEVTQINTEGILRCYDDGQEFFIPLYDYAAGHNDYRKISFLPYNQEFWQRNHGLVYTQAQLEQMQFFYRSGLLLNFDVQSESPFFPENNIYWSGETRLAYYGDVEEEDETALRKKTRVSITRDYDVTVQIFLDVNPSDTGLVYTSATVLDAFKTSFVIEDNAYDAYFLNVFFDLCEIERQALMERIEASDESFATIRQLYQEATQNIAAIKRQYFKEVERGTDLKAMRNWSNRVWKVLRIDNTHYYEMAVR